jgi:hypothetical protein
VKNSKSIRTHTVEKWKEYINEKKHYVTIKLVKEYSTSLVTRQVKTEPRKLILHLFNCMQMNLSDSASKEYHTFGRI